jgi:hydroxymethylpyrimidine pyrophosphatase-like HAD family hydrolase
MIAFGDAENDAPMLEFAGIGVAMGNATDALKAMADEVTLSNDEDGIAYTLHKYDLV